MRRPSASNQLVVFIFFTAWTSHEADFEDQSVDKVTPDVISLEFDMISITYQY